MGWFQKTCRQAGYMVHLIVRPPDQPTARHEVRREVEEQRVSPTVTLRRTTIEEIEFTPAPGSFGNPGHPEHRQNDSPRRNTPQD